MKLIELVEAKTPDPGEVRSPGTHYEDPTLSPKYKERKEKQVGEDGVVKTMYDEAVRNGKLDEFIVAALLTAHAWNSAFVDREGHTTPGILRALSASGKWPAVRTIMGYINHNKSLKDVLAYTGEDERGRRMYDPKTGKWVDKIPARTARDYWGTSLRPNSNRPEILTYWNKYEGNQNNIRYIMNLLEKTPQKDLLVKINDALASMSLIMNYEDKSDNIKAGKEKSVDIEVTANKAKRLKDLMNNPKENPKEKPAVAPEREREKEEFI